MIELVIFDIDGVVTDGRVIIDAEGREQKQMSMQDVDGIFELHRKGFKIAAITGEDTEIVGYFEKRFPWTFFYKGATTKSRAMEQIEQDTGISRDKICYLGDGKYDVEPLALAGLGVCPANAVDKAKMACDIILQREGGKGCVWELISILEKYNDPDSAENYFYERLTDHVNIFKSMGTDQKLMQAVIAVGNEIIETLDKDGSIYLCGNGGSAADAQHIATEFVSSFYKQRPGMNAEALSVNTSSLTSIGNDFGFERVFARQLEAKARQGDLVIGISTSGKSRNILEAFNTAKEKKIKTVMMTGIHDLSDVEQLFDYKIAIPSKLTPRIQEAHIFIGHLIAEYVEHKMFPRNC